MYYASLSWNKLSVVFSGPQDSLRKSTPPGVRRSTIRVKSAMASTSMRYKQIHLTKARSMEAGRFFSSRASAVMQVTLVMPYATHFYALRSENSGTNSIAVTWPALLAMKGVMRPEPAPSSIATSKGLGPASVVRRTVASAIVSSSNPMMMSISCYEYEA